MYVNVSTSVCVLAHVCGAWGGAGAGFDTNFIQPEGVSHDVVRFSVSTLPQLEATAVTITAAAEVAATAGIARRRRARRLERAPNASLCRPGPSQLQVW